MSGCYNVCDDLLVQIFERLPPKSIIRFRSLSKYWHSRFLSPEFLHIHRLRSSKNPPKVIITHVIVDGKKHEYKDIYTLHSRDQLPLDPDSRLRDIPGVEFPYHLHPLMGSVIGSCNGILCLYNNKSITLWNFSIRRKLIVSCDPSLKPSTFIRLALGFGFDSITDDYNIVSVSYDLRAAIIYSLKTDSWSEIPSPSTRFFIAYVELKACFFNGILHWVTTINGCLAVVSSGYDQFMKKTLSWIRVMKEYGNIESWSALFELKREPFDEIKVFQPIINGDILAYYGKGSKVYNIQTKFTKCLEFGPNSIEVEMDPYVESLELVDKERATTCGKSKNYDDDLNFGLSFDLTLLIVFIFSSS
ncbi:F-box/kelch-repeat protein At2g43270-like [Bidens hawaiensis]|uniref:F-box/kelch-repeat protein At2g43270-like n=1 Tax=Bidens hawaiensis TaxID=980011 RepID=UPI00404B66C1